jgi:hypothetical protein
MVWPLENACAKEIQASAIPSHDGPVAIRGARATYSQTGIRKRAGRNKTRVA